MRMLLTLTLACLPAWAVAQTSSLRPALAAVELTDPAGDVEPIIYRHSVGNGPETEVKYPGFDVTKVTIVSDGTRLTLTATLTQAPGVAAFDVLEFHIDADNNAKTGITHTIAPRPLAGLEYYGTLTSCLETSRGPFCTGTSDRPSGHSAIMSLEKYGRDWMFKDTLVDYPAVPPVKEAERTPSRGAVVSASVGYAALGLKPGQTIRLILREYCAATTGPSQGYFPDVLLTLK